MGYKYKVYGLNINSQIELNELVELDEKHWDEIDVNIYFGEIPIGIDKKILKGKKNGYSTNDMWFEKENIGTFYMKKGKEIIIRLYDGASLPYFKLYILGPCLSYILFQRESVAIHGGAMCINNQGIIITGDKGSGKSSLTSGLRHSGYDLVADDLVSVDMDEDIKINPAYPQQRLKSHTMKNFKYDKTKFKNIDGTSKTKYIIPVNDRFCKEKVILKGIFNLVVGDVDSVHICEISGSEKLNIIVSNLFSAKHLRKMGLSKAYFSKCMNLARKIPVYRIIRPEGVFSVSNQIEIIENTLGIN